MGRWAGEWAGISFGAPGHDKGVAFSCYLTVLTPGAPCCLLCSPTTSTHPTGSCKDSRSARWSRVSSPRLSLATLHIPAVRPVQSPRPLAILNHSQLQKKISASIQIPNLLFRTRYKLWNFNAKKNILFLLILFYGISILFQVLWMPRCILEASRGWLGNKSNHRWKNPLVNIS